MLQPQPLSPRPFHRLVAREALSPAQDPDLNCLRVRVIRAEQERDQATERRQREELVTAVLFSAIEAALREMKGIHDLAADPVADALASRLQVASQLKRGELDVDPAR